MGKSTDQTGVADDAKSVTRQIESATAYATAKGWTVDSAHVYIDDGVSGAEFARRPGFVKLMVEVGRKPRPFDVLVLSEKSRLGREPSETAYWIKKLHQAGVKLVSYLDQKELSFDTATERMVQGLVPPLMIAQAVVDSTRRVTDLVSSATPVWSVDLRA